MLEGGEIRGTWFDRTREYFARRKGQELSREELTQTEIVVLTSVGRRLSQRVLLEAHQPPNARRVCGFGVFAEQFTPWEG
jgi:hypothetical protein